MASVKTNLDHLFKTSEDCEVNGIDFEYGPVKFRCKRFGGRNQSLKAALATEMKPYSRQIELGTLSDAKEKEIAIKIFVKASLVGWTGVQMDGKDIEFSEENAIQLFTALPDLYNDLVKQSSNIDNYKEDLGNS
jgi:hypothetical protein